MWPERGLEVNEIVCHALQASTTHCVIFKTIAARRYWLFTLSCKQKIFISSIQCSLFRAFCWEVISTTCASCFIRGSKHLETIKTLGLRPRVLISFSVFGTSDEILTLVVDILRKISPRIICKPIEYGVYEFIAGRKSSRLSCKVYIVLKTHLIVGSYFYVKGTRFWLFFLSF